MRSLIVASLLVALFAPQAVLAQDKSSQGTVTLKEPKKSKPDPNGVVTLKPVKKPKPDPNGVVTLKDDKAKKDKDQAKRDKVEKLIEAQKAEDARKREKVEKLIDSKQKPADKPTATLLPFEETKAAQDAKKKQAAEKKK